ncbi:MAG TPA: ATPase domain-containing protein [Ktedonobacterales bacterium]|jgi:circadian clock protein KaiC
MSSRGHKTPADEPVGGRRLLEPTGIPNLDQVLGGGLPRGSLVLIVGQPGSGKTTMANQMAFAAARAGQRALVFTALSEPSSKLIAHLRSFSFYNDEMIGDTIEFLSLEQFLAGGLTTTGDEMVAAVRRVRATFVVLDGFRGMRGVDVDLQAARRFLYDVGTTLSMLGATTIITSEADPRDPAFFPEATAADIIIGLHYSLLGVKHRRRLEAIKVRGSAPLPGLHGLALGSDGITIYPRLETQVTRSAQPPQPDPLEPVSANDIPEIPTGPEARASFGLPELDGILGGGLTRSTNTLIIGSLGTGKTLLGLHFALAGVQNSEPTMFLGFRESFRQMLLKTAPFAMGRELRAALAPGGGLTLIRWAPVELNADIIADQLISTLDRIQAKRLIVDSITELERAAIETGDPRRVENYMAALVEALHKRGITSLFIREVPQENGLPLDFSQEPTVVLAENMLLLRQIEQQGKLHHVLSVQKMSFSSHDTTLLREFKISMPQGINILSLKESNQHLFGKKPQ